MRGAAPRGPASCSVRQRQTRRILSQALLRARGGGYEVGAEQGWGDRERELAAAVEGAKRAVHEALCVPCPALRRSKL